MKNLLIGLVVGFLAGAALIWFVARHSETETEKKAEPAKESRLIETNGQTFIRLDKATQERIGLKLSELKSVTIDPEIRAYGRVLDSGPLAALVIEIATARAALDTSQNEFQRLKMLHAQGQNVSTHALELAESVWKKDQVALDSAQLRLLSGWGKEIAGRKDLPEFVRSLAALEMVLVRMDVPLGEALEKTPTGGRVAPLTDEDHPVAAEYLGPVSSADAQSQGRGFLFVLKEKILPPGAVTIGWLTIPGEKETGVALPASALVRHEGEAFAYAAATDGMFARKTVELERPLTNAWFAAGEWKPGEKVVIGGAQQLLSEELKAESGEE